MFYPIMQLIGTIRNGGNAKQLVINTLQNVSGNNPMAANVMNMAKNDDAQGIERFARNICKERGTDFDQAFAQFRQRFGL